MKRKILCAALAALMLLCTACSDGKTPPDDNNGGNNNGTYHVVVEKTKDKIYEKSEQTVVLPNDCDEMTETAGAEFVRLFTEATELSVDIAYESEVTPSANGYYYFIGNTDALAAQKIDASYSLLGDSGVVIKTVDNADYLAGATQKAILYAVYEYMNQAFGYEFYAADEAFIGDGSDSARLRFDIVYRPSVANPCMMAGELNGDDTLYYKYRFQNYYQTWVAKNSDVYYAHTYFKILPKEKYFSEDPDWYSPDEEHKNLCLTRDPAMIDEFVKNCQEVIAADNGHNYFMLGQEDNFEFCGCESCKKRIAELGGFSSGVMMEFTNEVVRRLNDWMETEYPERNITFVTFAYNHTKEPPVTYNEKTKTYQPVSDTVVAEKNVSVQYVINMCDYYAPYNKSKSIVAALDGWSALSDSLTIWEYSTNFENYLDCFDNFGSMAENIRLLESHGVDYIVEQAAYNTCTTAFSELRLYLWSKLMWNSQLNTADLIDDFMFRYYKEGADDVRAYFDELYSHVDMLVKEYGVSVRSGGNECMIKTYWPYSKLNSLKEHLLDAYEAIKPLQSTQLLRYNMLRDRIAKQELWVDYWTHKFYPIYLDDADAFYRNWASTARKFGLTMIQEGLYI